MNPSSPVDFELANKNQKPASPQRALTHCLRMSFAALESPSICKITTALENTTALASYHHIGNNPRFGVTTFLANNTDLANTSWFGIITQAVPSTFIDLALSQANLSRFGKRLPLWNYYPSVGKFLLHCNSHKTSANCVSADMVTSCNWWNMCLQFLRFWNGVFLCLVYVSWPFDCFLWFGL